MSEEVVVVRSLRELDALVAERLMGWKWAVSGYPGEAERGRFLATPDCFSLRLAGRPCYLPASETESLVLDWFGATPHYTEWAGLESVIRNREEAGFSWFLNKDRLNGGYVCTFMTTVDDQYSERGDTAPIAACLAALASEGIRVQLETGE